MEISIVIPNYNGEDLLDNCLASIKAQSFKDYEVVVVDDASTDASLEHIPDWVRLIQNEQNLGFAGSVNRGIQESLGEKILLLNTDVVLREDFLEKIASAMQSDHIFSVSSKMIRYYERDLIDDAGDSYNLFGWVWKRGDGDPVKSYMKPESVFSSCAGAGLYRKKVFDEIGLFDEMHFAYLEDVDLGWRARIHGYENYYEPEAVCYHIGSATLAEGQRYSERKVELSARNNVYILYKNMPALQLILNSPFLAVGFGIKYLYFAKRGYEKAYREGFIEGVKDRKKLKKVKYDPKNFRNYLKIEKDLAVNTLKYVAAKTIGKLM